MTITYRLAKGAALTYAELDANFTDLNTKITDLVGGAPGALDTLNELAAALADDANYAATITTALGTKEPAITAGTVTQYYKGDKTWATLDSAEVTENTNLYYTDARADARIAAAGGGSTWVEKTGDYTAIAGDKLIVDTSTAVVITLPAAAT